MDTCPRCNRALLVLFFSVECTYCDFKPHEGWTVLNESAKEALRNPDYTGIFCLLESTQEKALELARSFELRGDLLPVYSVEPRYGKEVYLHRCKPEKLRLSYAWLADTRILND